MGGGYEGGRGVGTYDDRRGGYEDRRPPMGGDRRPLMDSQGPPRGGAPGGYERGASGDLFSRRDAGPKPA